MKTYARIENGVVVEIFRTAGDITQMFHPDFKWVEVPDGIEVEERWAFQAGVFSPPAPPQSTRADEIKARLVAIDAERIRPVSEVVMALSTGASVSDFARDKLIALEIEANDLRAELADLV